MDPNVFVAYGKGPLGGEFFGPIGPRNLISGLEDNLTSTQLARAQFLTWLKQTAPGIFRAALQKAETAKAGFAAQTRNPAALAGLGENGESQTWWQSLAEGITTAGTAYLAYKGQKAAIDMNLARAQQGLPPMDYSSYAAPTVRTQVDVSPEILARLRQGGMNTLLLVGGIAAAFFLLPRLLGRARR